MTYLIKWENKSGRFSIVRRLLLRELACLSALCFVLSCSSASQEKPPKTVKTLTFITNSDSPFWTIVRKGVNKADAELPNIEVIFKIPYSGKSTEQERYINEAVQRDSDAIAISPIDPVHQKPLINTMAKRVLFITHDSDAPDSDRAFYLGADNRDAGHQAGKLLKKALPRGGKIMVFVGKSELENSQDRFAGLKEELQDSNINVLDLKTDNNDLTVAKDNAAEALRNNPDLAGMVGLWSYNGPAILESVKAANKTGKVKIVCFDDDPKTLDGIKEGSIFGTIAQQPYQYGYRVVQLASKILQGDRSLIPETKKIIIPTITVQRENLEEFKDRNAQLLSSN
jgi:ribose transport system substrate-binding protein